MERWVGMLVEVVVADCLEAVVVGVADFDNTIVVDLEEVVVDSDY